MPPAYRLEQLRASCAMGQTDRQTYVSRDRLLPLYGRGIINPVIQLRQNRLSSRLYFSLLHSVLS